MKDLVCGFVSASEISPTFNNSFVISICFKVSSDRTGTCICTDIAVSACYFCILKYYASFIEYTAPVFLECWTCNGSLQVPYRVIQDCCLDYFLWIVLGRVDGPITFCFIYLNTCQIHLYREGMVAAVWKLKNIPRDGTFCHFQARLEVRTKGQWAQLSEFESYKNKAQVVLRVSKDLRQVKIKIFLFWR